jgi:FkbM family methyltransferase
MKRKDRIKLDFTRNWKLPGKERLSGLLKPSVDFKAKLKNGITWLVNEDIAIYTTADNYIEWSIISTGTYEDEINKLIRISLKSGNAALDIGGNLGLQSLRMAQCVGIEGTVYAFEPLSYLQQKFKNNVALNSATNVTLFPFALSDAAGEAEFTISENLWNQGTFSLGDKGDGTTSQKVIIKVADEMSEIQKLKSLSLIKLDVEGFEFPVLKGLLKTLSEHKPRIIFEYDENYWLKNGHYIADCFEFLTGLNYKLYQVTSVGCEYIEHADDIIGGNLFGL